MGDTTSFEVAYVGNHGGHVQAEDNPSENINQPAIDGFTSGLSTNERRPFFAGGVRSNVLGVGGNYGWTQTVDAFFNEAQNWYNSLQTKFTRRFSAGWSAQLNYTLQKAEQEQDDYWIYDPEISTKARQASIARTTSRPPSSLSCRSARTSGSVPIGAVRPRRWQAGGSSIRASVILSGSPFDVTYRNASLDRDTGPNRPDLIGDPDGDKTQDAWFNTTPIGSPGSAFGRPAPGTFGNLGRNQLRGPGFWIVDASLFKNVWMGQSRRLEVRIESVNIFNHVNLGNPNGEVGVPGNDNPDAGRITSTAGPQRNFQFGFRFVF